MARLRKFDIVNLKSTSNNSFFSDYFSYYFLVFYIAACCTEWENRIISEFIISKTWREREQGKGLPCHKRYMERGT